ncbi:amidohydrolase family protein [Paeniglutamicibacter sp. ABSL32-1]|uniref:alpha-D-ribose 1-methylphosphonate 5-triphosphate diphosphatase n=1 Tax=Paeniglutamicibacter quisquiliarum TaxID=2849498 RepID=UPI001C2CD8E7|nr:amidohydrolase family protein [Paeniglutamicibacter quisquiliarum]
MVASYTLGHVRVLAGDRILEDQLISVVDGVIEEIRDHRPGLAADIDGGGKLCVPGLVDLHSDTLAREYRPRPGARMPIGSPGAAEVHDAVNAYQDPRLDHRILHRLDVRCRGGVEMFRERLRPGQVPLVSYEDHTPGQGQYRDRRVMERWLREAQHMDAAQAVEHVDRLIAERDGALPVRTQTLAWLGELAASGSIRLMGHDPVTPAEIDELVQRRAGIAEFPTTLEAARHAVRRGVATVAGAPNVLLGGSHSGNVSALDLAKAGVLDILASDYLPSSLLPAAFELARLGHATLPVALAMVTANPAAAAGLDDRGILRAGYRADLVLCSILRDRPRVMRTLAAAH